MRKGTQAALRERKERLRLFIEYAPAALAMFDCEMRYLAVSRRWLEDYGLGGRDLIGHSHYEIFPEIPERWKEVHRRGIAGEVIRAEEDRFVRLDGRVQWLRWEVRPWNQGDGALGGIILVTEDITERKRAELALEQNQSQLEELVAARTADLAASEDRLRLILESSADGLIGLDARGTVTFTNPAAEALLGYGTGELIGQDLHAVIHPVGADGTAEPPALCPILAALKTGRTARVEHEVFRRADGTVLPVAFSTRPMRRDAAIVGAVVAFSDATLRLQAEQAREQARAAAERLARIKSEFLANMSHEIRTPLNGVLGMAQVGYRASQAHPKLHESFARILESGQLLLSVVNDILDFSKIEAGKLRIEALPIAPGAIVAEVAESFRQRARDKGIALQVSAAPGLPATCLGDPVRLAQILQNLLGNAIKFTHQGRVTVNVGRAGDDLVLTVDDTGIGMTEDQLGRLFRPFEQADTGTTRTFGGTGLGLAITHRLVELMGGEIRVTSRPGKGTRFQVRLPGAPAKGEGAPGGKAWTAPAGGPRLKGLRLLVAEDNEVNRLVLEDMLTAEGAAVTLVENGRRALAAVGAAGAAWDAVLMDLQMPEMDGLEATRRILQLAPDLPVIGQTAHALAQELAQCRAAGMVDQVSKPIEHEDLVAVVLRHARRDGLVPSPAATAPAAPAAGATPSDGLDWAGLAQRYKGNTAFIERIAALAVAGNRELPARLRQWAAEGNLAEIGTAAHALKSVAGNLMAHDTLELAESTQRAARGGSAQTVPLALQLADSLELLLGALAAHLQRGEGGAAP